MSQISGWGNYPKITGNIHYPEKDGKHEQVSLPAQPPYIAMGARRSYGDSALFQQVISTQRLNRFIGFNQDTGLLVCDAGITLDEILTTFVSQGWFLPVTPGTKFITVGGAVASDVHGKNHHIDGCFSEFVSGLKIQIGDELFHCSRQQHPDLFHATCGGMGLTGLITEVAFYLKPIKSAFIAQRNIKSANLEQSLQLFEEHASAHYSVAWIDCLATGDSLGRSIISIGEHVDSGGLIAHSAPKLNVPFNFPEFVLNPLTIQAFNYLYYGKEKGGEQTKAVHYNPFFYPLDGINNWNRMYGKNGFTQYQCALPKESGLSGLKDILKKISDSKQGSFLAVLKALGKANDNPLSFPIEGYTLALDFKVTSRIWSLLNQLDELVLSYGGKLYLTKDARMSEAFFKTTYPRWEEVAAVRDKYGATPFFASLQSQRLGISR